MVTERRAGPTETVLITTHVELAGHAQSAAAGELDRPVTQADFIAALRDVCERHPMLRARLTGAAPEWSFVFDQSFEDVGVVVEDIGSRPIEDVLATENDNVLDLTTGPLWRALVLTDGAHPDAPVIATVVTWSHAIVDGVSVFAFLRQLLARIDGRESRWDELPVRPPMEELMPPKATGDSDWQPETPPIGEWAFAQVVGIDQRRTVIVVDVIDAGDLDLIRRRCRTDDVKLDAFFIALVQEALARTAPEALAEPVLCAFDARNELHPRVSPDEFGVYMKDFALYDPAWRSGEVGLWDRARSISAQVPALRGHAIATMADYPAAELCEQIKMAADYPLKAFSYAFSVSNIGRQSFGEPDGPKFKTVYLNSADRGGIMGIQTVFHEMDGELRVALSYTEPLMSTETVDRVRADLIDILRSEARSSR